MPVENGVFQFNYYRVSGFILFLYDDLMSILYYNGDGFM